MSTSDSGDEQVLTKVLGPPADIKESLEDLAQDTGDIMKQFDKLKQPYIDQLTCTDLNGGNDLTTVLKMISYYRKEYLDLREETIPLARDLIAYADAQKALLPLVSVDDSTADSDNSGTITMKELVETNKPLAEEYLKKATAVSEKAIKLKNNWNTAINGLEKTIDECYKQITGFSRILEKLTEEDKKSTLYTILSAIGALVLFASAAFLPGTGILAAVGPDGELGKLSIADIIKLGKVDEAIAVCKSGIKTAVDIREKMTKLLPFMESIKKDLSSVSEFWSDIVMALTTLDNFYKILASATGKELFKKIRQKIIDQWDVVYKAANDYIKIVAT